MTETIYNASDIAVVLRVTRGAVINFRQRYPEETPQPDYASPSGTGYWNADGLKAWKAWHAKTVDSRNPRNAPWRREKAEARDTALAEMRDQLEKPRRRKSS